MPGSIAVYGATGYTGKLIVAELRRRGVEDVVLLDALAEHGVTYEAPVGSAALA